MSTRSPLSSTIRSSLLSALHHNEEDCLTMQHGRASRNASHRGRRNAEPFAAYDEDATAAPSFAAVSSTLLPSLADRVRVPQGEQRWLRFDSRGSASYIDKIDKQALVTSLQLPARDLVMVNPLVPTPIPPAILIREHALVVVLGALRMVIGSDRVYLLSVPAENPNGGATPSSSRSRQAAAAATVPTSNAASNSDANWAFPDVNGTFEADLSNRLAASAAAKDRKEAATRERAERAAAEGGRFDGGGFDGSDSRQPSPLDDVAEEGEGDGTGGYPRHPEPLPYELCALECALAATTAALRADANALALATAPALERLGGECVTREGLEHVRSAKLAIKRCEARVEAVKRELSEIIDDDEDLRDCLLSRRRGEKRETEARVAAAAAAVAAAEEEGEEGDEEAPPAVATAVSSPPAPAAPTLRRRGSSLAGGSVAGKGAAAAELYYLQQQQQHFKDRADVLLVENMLESYYLQVGQILSRLAVLKERIDDTEDLVNVQLDARRNELVALNLVVTLAMTAFAFVSMIGGLLGMNLSPLPVENSILPFILITAFALIGGGAIFGLTLYWARVKSLMFIPKARAM